MFPEIVALTELCERWGGKLRLLSTEDFDKIFPKPGDVEWPAWKRGLYHAPFAENIGINWKRKIVYGPLSQSFWPVLIHEAGHVFGSKVNPKRSDDYSFFGWEIAVIKHIGADLSQWEYSNREYAVGKRDTMLGMCSRYEKERVYSERLAHAKKIGIVNAKLEPISVR
jgi:hypothetical protein